MRIFKLRILFPVFLFCILLMGTTVVIAAKPTTVTAQDAQDMIDTASDKIDDVEDEIDAAKDDGYSEGAINGAEGKLTSAKNQLDNAISQFEKGHYEQAYDKADDAYEKALDAQEHLETKASGDNTDDENDYDEEDTDLDEIIDNDDEETIEEDRLERNLVITLTVNGQNAIGSTADDPVLVTGDEALITWTVKNTGTEMLEIKEIVLTTSALGARVDRTSYEMAGALNAGGTLAGTQIIQINEYGQFLGSLDSNTFKTKVSIEFEGDWDYEFSVYWKLV